MIHLIHLKCVDELFPNQTNMYCCRFNSRHINVLITSDVLEHDIDIKDFNYVIRYDTPNNFLTYMLSKFQACKTKSQFIILAPKYSDYDKKHSVYSTMEEGIGDVCIR